MDSMQQTLVQRLVDLHGESGLSPSAADWHAILSQPSTEPLAILNLLEFKLDGGREAYHSYSQAVGPAFLRVGGKRRFFGQVAHIFPASAGWNAAILTIYPSPQALAEMWLDPEFIAAHAHRIDGVLRSQVLVMGAAS
jgi:uncharacterized protein (DUF1330 family)